MHKSRAAGTLTLISSLIGGLGLYVLIGWTIGVEQMVRVVPNSVAMGLNTALMFIGIAATLLLSAAGSTGKKVAIAIAAGVVVLSGLILLEHALDRSIGIDWTALHATVKDGNPRPGRTAPNTCLGFLFAGLALLSFFVLEQQRRQVRRQQAMLTGLVLLIGFTALIGYFLQLEVMYRFAVYNRMAAPTSLAMSLVGIALSVVQYRARRDSGLALDAPDTRITKIAAGVLTVVALGTGLTGFVILKQGFEQSLSEATLRDAKSDASAFSSILDQGILLAATITDSAPLQRAMDTLNTVENDALSRITLKEAADNYRRSGLTAITLVDLRNQTVFSTGMPVRSRAPTRFVLQLTDVTALLMWDDGFVLFTEIPIYSAGHVVGRLLAEQRLHALDAMITEARRDSNSTDVLVCARESDQARCFPSRFYPVDFHVPMYKDGKPYLPITHALLHKTGVMSVKDYRGIPVLAAYTPIGNSGLGMVLKTDSIELLAPIRQRLNLLALLLIPMVGFGTWILRAQVRPLARKLVQDHAALQESEARFNIFMDHNPAVAFMKDEHGRMIYANKTFEQAFKFDTADWQNKTDAELWPSHLAAIIRDTDLALFASKESVTVEEHVPTKAGLRVWLASKFPFESLDGSPIMGGIAIDITELKNIEAALLIEKERLRVTLSSIGDAVITTDTLGQVNYLNPVAESMTGWRDDEARGRPLADVFQIVHDVTGAVAQNPVEIVLQTGNIAGLEDNTTLIQRGGARFAIEDSAAPIRAPDGTILGVVLVFHDVTHARKMAAEMTFQATHDTLTGLINRREFERRLEFALLSGLHQHKTHSLLYLDLDQFKVVNDTCGHVAGDALLRQLTTLMQDELRSNDTLARLGGDEFGVLLEGCMSEPALRIADNLRRSVGGFRFAWNDKIFPIGVSIGLVTFSNGGITLSDVMSMADAACYVAKDNGRNRVHVHTPDDQALANRSGEMGWIGRIQKALDEDRFVLYSQKILSLGIIESEEDHYEILLRMRGDDGTMIPPMAFIPAAERYGMMIALDRWVVKTAFAQFVQRHPVGSKPAMCAINLSGKTLSDDSFLAFVIEQFAQYPIPPHSICFEVTETAAIANLQQATLLIREIKALGCRFALDDFGSGMSSFAYLKHLPVDFLKIDGGFVKDMVSDPIDRAMVKSIHEIGGVMGIQTIAEFVENDDILLALRGIGVNFAQGYGVEKPRPA